MKKAIRVPHTEGHSSKQAHADLPKQGMYERETSREGFFGPATHFHHQHPPTSWINWEGDLRPHCFDFNRVDANHTSPWSVPILLENADCKIRIWQPKSKRTALFRNADGDDLLFIHQGSGDLYCDYGHLTFSMGDYLLIPRGTTWRMDLFEDSRILMIENTDDCYGLPDKGMLGHHAVFDPAVLDMPKVDSKYRDQYSEEKTTVAVKRHPSVSHITYPFNPLDTVGWHGEVSVVKLNWRDIRPVMSHRYHLPPSAHTTFVAKGFVVCTFVPRPVESDQNALKVPFYHSNEDYDEVLFYHQGDFFSRDNIESGMATLHPAGFAHGPHPKAYNAALTQPKSFIDEVAVMIDTRQPLVISQAAKAQEWQDYVYSWCDK